MIVSVVIPCFNEEKYIISCLFSICSQKLPHDTELKVLVCDGKSTDQTIFLIKEFIQTHPEVHYLVNEKRTTPFALNLGITKEDSNVVIIFGAHAVMKENYIRYCIEKLQSSDEIGCVGGIINNIYETKQSSYIGLAMSSPFGVGNAHFRTGTAEGYVDTVAFGAYSREAINQVGLFDEELIRNQDDEYNYRVLKYGYKIWLDPQIQSDYYVRSSIKKLFKQYEQYGYWKVYVNKKHRTVTTIRQLIPFFFVMYLLVGSISSLLSVFCFYVFIGIFLFYVITGIYFARKKTVHLSEILNVFSIFFILHFSYGLGYLKGVFDFFVLNKKIRTQEKLTR